MTHAPIKQAFILGAGLGTRMRPLTATKPKPLVPLAGKPLIDHVIERLKQVGVERFIVNVHYCGDQLEAHLKQHDNCTIIISDERETLLDTGGGLRKAIDHLERAPFFIHNSDSVWLEDKSAQKSNLTRMAERFDEHTMQSLLLLADKDTALGYDGKGDFFMEEEGTLKRRPINETSNFVFTGVSIASASLLEAASKEPAGIPFSLNKLWDQGLSAQRVYGIEHKGRWMHVGTPEALKQAEDCIKDYEMS